MTSHTVSHHTGSSGHHRSRQEPRDPVKQNVIAKELIAKERKYYQLHSSFTINPFKPTYAVTGKPYSLSELTVDDELEDAGMRAVIDQAQKAPPHKQLHPETSSQEYGWMSKPLIETDRNDERLHHPKRKTDITKCRIFQQPPDQTSRPASQRMKPRNY